LIRNLKFNENTIAVEIKDLTGKTVYLNRNISSSEIQLPDSAPGIYFVIILNGKKKVERKILIQ
jgi:hypothetical protein